MYSLPLRAENAFALLKQKIFSDKISVNLSKEADFMADLLYSIKANTPKEEIIRQLREHPEIKFVSLMGIDLAGNDTD